MFKKAERKKAKLKLAITGPTGSGKTYSALRLAKGIGGKIAVIDTENGSASLYSEKFDFDVLDMKPPFTTEKYIEAINFAEKNGYETIVIDSLTHAWAGEGGLLEQKAQLDSRPNSNHWTNWGPIDKKDLALKNAYLHSTCHIISTMRSKMEYAQAEENGKKKIQKVGLAPIQRDGLAYEFTTVFDIAMDHQAETSKDRTGVFDGRIFKITEETGEELAAWLNSGKTELTEDKKQGEPKEKIEETEPIKFNPETQKEDQNPAEYVVKVGKKLNGMRLKDILDQEIEGYIDYIVGGSKKTGKPLSGDWVTFVETAEKYLATKKDPKLADDEINF